MKNLNDFASYKIVVYIPEKDFNEYLSKILKLNINQIGNYKNCISWTNCTSSWTPLDNANPYIGQINQTSIEKEMRLEFKCDTKNIKQLVKLLKDIHPYEEPEIDIIPLISIIDTNNLF